ncbi:FecR domain-containing protein [Nitrogeniibacter aestuarii]|uniref:FecR domain-containing protein n=1 Tax=Nitrogeniibacter aestuarii TaxID=2815343 RepID=UPI001D10BFCF|nr:FecR domain-containing protein [Nitrogeniibacter aestuarii]
MRLIECHDIELMRPPIAIEFQARCAGRSARRIFVFLGLYLTSQLVFAECSNPVATIVSMQGSVEYSAAGRTEWHPARVGQGLCPGELVTVRRYGRAAVQFDGDVLTRLDQFSTLEIAATPRDGDVALGLQEGVAHFISRLKRRVEVITPVVNALVEGTEFTVVATRDGGKVVVAEGHVAVANSAGRVRLTAGQAAQVTPDAAPVAIQVQPLDSARWAIYYPLVAWPLDKGIEQSTAFAAQGKFEQALDHIPSQLNEGLASYRANLLLGIGRFDEAAGVLDAAGEKARDPLAVRAIMQLAQGQFGAARQSAEAMGGASASSLLARSYVEQSEGRLDAALASVEQAIALVDRNPLAWARKAELELTLADADAAETSASKALSIAPGTVHAKALVGFARLLGDERERAREVLLEAVGANPADPLAHFALGLLHVREGNDVEGRRELELAVLLDPSNVEYRSALASAYMRSGDDYRATNQLALAETLDPASPTPKFLSAQRKLRQGDVIGAMSDGESALAANGARLTLRTPAMLDSDQAARGVTLASSYLTAGFDATLTSLARDVVESDPQSASGHRMMARALTRDRRLENARVSEQLQGFAFGKVGDPMIMPEALIPSLPALQGARLSSLHETTALFDERPYAFSAGVLTGSQETFASSVAASMTADRFQAGIGHFDYNSDGFSEGGKVDLEATRAEFRWRASSDLTLFADLLHDNLAVKDVTQALYTINDETAYERRGDLVRVGFRSRLRHDSKLTGLVANEYGHRSNEESRFPLVVNLPGIFVGSTQSFLPFDEVVSRRGGELRLDGAANGFKYFGGVSYWHGKNDGVGNQISRTLGEGLTPIPVFPFVIYGPIDRTDERPFSLREDFASVRVAGGVTLPVAHRTDMVARADFVRFDNDRIKWDQSGSAELGRRDTDRILPSIGLVSSDFFDTNVRAAFMQTVATPTAGNQSLLPTQFAGFDAVFDDVPGTRSRRWALGADKVLSGGVRIGGEWSLRKLDLPGEMCGTDDCLTHWTERRHRLFASWPITARVGAELGWAYDSLALDRSDQASGGTYLPLSARTETLPARIFVQWSDSVRTLAEVVRVRQDVSNLNGTSTERHHAGFWVTNLRLEYGKPDDRWGFGLDVRNLFDQDALIQDTDLVTGVPRTPAWYPERSIFVSGRLRF